MVSKNKSFMGEKSASYHCEVDTRNISSHQGNLGVCGVDTREVSSHRGNLGVCGVETREVSSHRGILGVCTQLAGKDSEHSPWK